MADKIAVERSSRQKKHGTIRQEIEKVYITPFQPHTEPGAAKLSPGRSYNQIESHTIPQIPRHFDIMENKKETVKKISS